MKYLFGMSFFLAACANKEDCVSGQDSDADGLDDCVELEMGTDANLADSDGDGFTDAEELDCVSDPLKGDEVCYSCGWEHIDPDTLTSTGNEEGDVIANLLMSDQCGDEVSLWDFHGGYNLLYMTVGWCNTCINEATDLQTVQDEFIAETNLDFQFLLVLYESYTGYPAEPEDGVAFAEQIGSPSFPVFTDGKDMVVGATPLTINPKREVCALSPELEIIGCFTGYDGYENALNTIKDHAGL